jgi:hypothetical protein
MQNRPALTHLASSWEHPPSYPPRPSVGDRSFWDCQWMAIQNAYANEKKERTVA